MSNSKRNPRFKLLAKYNDEDLGDSQEENTKKEIPWDKFDATVRGVSAFLTIGFTILTIIFLHMEAADYIPALVLTYGMFPVPFFTSRLRRSNYWCVRSTGNSIFVSYGILVLASISYSVGYSNHQLIGFQSSGWTAWASEARSGAWAAFFYGVASVAGHYMGGIKRGYSYTRDYWIAYCEDDKNGCDGEKVKNVFKRALSLSKFLNWGSAVVCLIMFLTELAVKNQNGTQWLWLLTLITLVLKAADYPSDEEFGAPKFAFDLFGLFNIISVVLLVAGYYYNVGRDAKGSGPNIPIPEAYKNKVDLGGNIFHAVVATLIAIGQHFTI